jgi:ankyrin repeat protein/L-ascorbate metabolism protein UlaG (beta-lactamase superfamily)
VAAGAAIETVRWLLAKGANPNVQDWWGITPVYHASLSARVDILQELLQSGARLDAPMWDGATPLLGAFSASRPDGVFWLLEHGARLDTRTGAGETIISLTTAHGFRDLLEKLWAEAERAGLTRVLSEYPLHRAASHSQTAIAGFLMAKGLKPDLRDERGKTPLHRAAQGGAVEVDRVLLGKGVDVDARDGSGTTPLHDAVKRGKLEMVRLLLERKANANARDGGDRTPMALATIYGYPEIAGVLDAAGAADPRGAPPSSIPTLLATPLRSGEAQVWFLGHCGFAVRTKTRLLIFDYVRRTQQPQSPSLANGFINPEELRGLDVTVFVSHNHTDHFDPVIFDWEKTAGTIRYVFGWKEREGPRITTMADRRASTRIGNMEVHVVNCNHNLIPEVAYLVKADGLALFHSGDYGAMPADLAADMAYLRKRAGQRIDLAFLGTYRVIAPVLKPAVAFPLHMGWLDYAHEGSARAIERLAAGTRAIACDNEGDRYTYRAGTVR